LQEKTQETSPVSAVEHAAVPQLGHDQAGCQDNHLSDLYHVDHDTRPIPDTMTATLTQNKRVTPQSHWQDVRHICLTTPDQMAYAPGDMIMITPKNFAVDVDMLIDLMGWADVADNPVEFVPGVGLRGKQMEDLLPPPPIPYLVSSSSSSADPPPYLTLRILLTDYLDIRAIPRRSFFASIAHYTNDIMHKERLLEFTNPEYVDEFWDYTTRPRRSILEVLQEFETVKIPWQHAASVFPPLRGRQFSIASGGELKRTPDGNGTRFELLIAIVKYQTIIKKIREGVCTRYLAVLRPGSTLRIQLQRGGLKPNLQQLLGPAVLVGPGTGLAPLRAMVWEKAAFVKAYYEKNPNGPPPPVGTTILLFGGRNRTADYFFEEEWKELMASGSINLRVMTAFSRDQRQKIYVQDRIRENSSLFFRLLHNQAGSVFICGSSGSMPQAVRGSLIECFQQQTRPSVSSLSDLGDAEGRSFRKPHYTLEQAEQYLIEMEQVGRYKQETW
jgi:sulfite reductase alpha subunit-like flavoprotein